MEAPEQIEPTLKKLIIEALALEDLTPNDIDSNEPLFGEGLGLDSIDALEIAMVLEQVYGIEVDDDSDANQKRYTS
ncbi:MAG: phosphopantetheine-binding protein, partial [Myxococcota bacterium]|nr:phosphopantetheine-binding protein [Myxococcota bacterium]